MKKLIEIFKWDYEGEYQQYFYVVEDEEAFIKEVLEYLNTVHIKDQFPWSDCLTSFREGLKIEPYFLDGYIGHLKEYYYINYEYGIEKFTLTKTSKKQIEEVIKWEEN